MGNEPVGPYLHPSLAIRPAYIPTYTSQLRVAGPGVIGFLFRCRVRVARNLLPGDIAAVDFGYLVRVWRSARQHHRLFPRAQGDTGGGSEAYYGAHFLWTITAGLNNRQAEKGEKKEDMR